MDKQSEQQALQDIIAPKEDGFGLQFKTAREEQNLTVEDISLKLHLDTKIIRALEKEDYTQLPVATFVCGYIRNYAKFLKIQPEPLIEYYKAVTSSDKFEPELKVIKSRRLPGQSIVFTVLSTLIAPILTLLLMLLLVGAGWQLWLYVSENYLNRAAVSEMESISLIESTGVSGNEAETLLLPDIGDAYGEKAIAATGEQFVEATQTKAPLTESAAVVAEADTPIIATDTDTNTSTIVAEGSHPLENSQQTKLLEQGVSQVKNQLLVEFTGSSWVKIQGADGKVLASGLKKASKVMLLKGKLPYQVFLGDARVVKVSFNGQVFDHSKYINENNIARFKVK